jgi:hypothetical protein
MLNEMNHRITIGLLCIASAASACDSKKASEAAPSVVAEPRRTEQKTEPVEEVARQQPAVGAGYELDKPKAVETPAPANHAPKPVAANAVQGPVVTGEGFSVHMQAAPGTVAGKPSSAEVVLKAQAPFHCNDKYPYKLALDPTPGVSYPEQTVRNIAIGEQSSTLAVPFTASAPGKHTLSGQLSFSVCTDDKCLVEKQKVSVTIDVKGAS